MHSADHNPKSTGSQLAHCRVASLPAPACVQLNSPSKITGTYELLLERFGQEGATEIITKNPGVLVCTPSSLASQSNEDIKKAADMVVTLEENKEPIKLFILANFLAFPLLVGYRVGVLQGWW